MNEWEDTERHKEIEEVCRQLQMGNSAICTLSGGDAKLVQDLLESLSQYFQTEYGGEVAITEMTRVNAGVLRITFEKKEANDDSLTEQHPSYTRAGIPIVQSTSANILSAKLDNEKLKRSILDSKEMKLRQRDPILYRLFIVFTDRLQRITLHPVASLHRILKDAMLEVCALLELQGSDISNELHEESPAVPIIQKNIFTKVSQLMEEKRLETYIRGSVYNRLLDEQPELSDYIGNRSVELADRLMQDPDFSAYAEPAMENEIRNIVVMAMMAIYAVIEMAGMERKGIELDDGKGEEVALNEDAEKMADTQEQVSMTITTLGMHRIGRTKVGCFVVNERGEKKSAHQWNDIQLQGDYLIGKRDALHYILNDCGEPISKGYQSVTIVGNTAIGQIGATIDHFTLNKR